jgi:hypothetical protein
MRLPTMAKASLGPPGVAALAAGRREASVSSTLGGCWEAYSGPPQARIEEQTCLLEGGPAEFGRLSALQPAVDEWGPQASTRPHVIVAN